LCNIVACSNIFSLHTLDKISVLRLLLLSFCVYLLACSSARHNQNSGIDEQLKTHIVSIATLFAPDKRTTLFSVQAFNGTVKGETTSAAAKDALLQRLRDNKLNYTDSILVLPSASLQSQHFGVVTISVANLRTQPSHRAELATQATMGTALKVWKRERGWYLVQTPDEYLAWVDGDAIQRYDSASFSHWHQLKKVIYTEPFGFIYDDTSGHTTISDLVYGDILAATNEAGRYTEVMLPDGRKGFVHQQQCTAYDQWRNSRQPKADNIVGAARKLMGVPYLWGGTSFKGVDCSGFTKTVYFMNGLVIPRDASQQALLGSIVDTAGDWKDIQPGDLLFFGNRERDGKPEQVVHVGIWMGDGEFIHSSGKVQVGSLNPSANNYDAGEHKRFLRVKRISPQQSLFDLRKTGY
jgi:gamma-D-glutamyl-L-lysine dipeptidyl-peptidase